MQTFAESKGQQAYKANQRMRDDIKGRIWLIVSLCAIALAVAGLLLI
jgi:hypothetical protein